jgi:HEAT repeat protein
MSEAALDKATESTRSNLAALLADPEPALRSPDPSLRRLAVTATIGRPGLLDQVAAMLEHDPAATVRRECAEVLGATPGARTKWLLAALRDESPPVREAAAFALGEHAERGSVSPLLAIAIDDKEDSLAREAAVAALGAIGDAVAVPALLDLIASGPPQVRRRCVAALTVFDDDRIEPALQRAATDRNPMVREAAEMVVGRTVD